MFAGVPLIETSRLKLRGHRIDDFEAMTSMWTDPEVVRHIGGKPSTSQQVWMRLLSYVGHWPILGFGYWAVEEKVSGNFIGELGFANFKRDLPLRLTLDPEMGWALRSEFHRKGYATEALHAALKWGDLHLPSKTTTCLIDPGNKTSIKVALKLGFTQKEEFVFNDKASLFFSRAH